MQAVGIGPVAHASKEAASQYCKSAAIAGRMISNATDHATLQYMRAQVLFGLPDVAPRYVAPAAAIFRSAPEEPANDLLTQLAKVRCKHLQLAWQLGFPCATHPCCACTCACVCVHRHICALLNACHDEYPYHGPSAGGCCARGGPHRHAGISTCTHPHGGRWPHTGCNRGRIRRGRGSRCWR